MSVKDESDFIVFDDVKKSYAAKITRTITKSIMKRVTASSIDMSTYRIWNGMNKKNENQCLIQSIQSMPTKKTKSTFIKENEMTELNLYIYCSVY